MGFTIDPRSLHALVAFVTVAEHRSFSAAARRLGVSTSAVSQAVRRLERQVAAPLFFRTTRAVRTSDVGERLLADVGPAVRGMVEALRSARTADGALSGTLRINAPRIAIGPLRPVLAEVARRHPGMALDVSVDDRFVDIVRAGFDLGVRLGEAVHADMVSVPLTPPTRFVVVGSPGYLRARGRPAEPQDLDGHACIGWRAPSSGALYRWELSCRGEEREITPAGPLFCDETELMVAGALDGLGLAYLPELAIAEHLAARRLVPVLESWAASGPGLCVYFPRRAQGSPKLRAFLDVVHAQRRAARRPTPRRGR